MSSVILTKFAIQIILYYDELEIVNPLGSKNGKHKIGNFNVAYKFASVDFVVTKQVEIQRCQQRPLVGI